MYSYSAIQWLFFFYFYCFAGWCVESAYVSIRTRKLTNRGFLKGPFLPIYGSGAIMMLVVSGPFQDHIFLTYLAGCLGATVLEYVTSVVMEALFKVRYWDYSRLPFNFRGRICLGTTLSWGFLTVLMTRFLHVPVEKTVLSVPDQELTVITLVLTAGIFFDFALSVKVALDLRNLLSGMGRIRREMSGILSSLDAIISRAGEAVENLSFVGSIAELKTGIENRLERIRGLAQTKPSEYLESVKEEVFELRTRYFVNLEIRNRLGRLKKLLIRTLFRANPSMTSVEFEEELKELKDLRERRDFEDARQGEQKRQEEQER